MSHAFLVTGDNSISILLKGRSMTVRPDHPNYDKVKKGLVTLNEDELFKLIDVCTAINQWAGQTISVQNGQVTYKGTALHNVITERLLSQMNGGFPHQPLANFLENVMQNPSKRAIDQGYLFLEHGSMPITPDGCFLAYKSVDSNFKDHHTGKFDNKVGSVQEMPRNEVSDDPDVDCSNGFHVGSYNYAKDFGSGEKYLMVVKVNPKDIVSVPKDHNCEKMRVCRYEVVSICEKVMADSPIYSGCGKPMSPTDEYFSDYEDDDLEDEFVEECEGCYENVSDCCCEEEDENW